MACESCIQIIQPTVQPTITQCIQVVQAAPTIVPPESINVLIGGVQQVTYFSETAYNNHFLAGLIIGVVCVVALLAFITMLRID